LGRKRKSKIPKGKFQGENSKFQRGNPKGKIPNAKGKFQRGNPKGKQNSIMVN
jgi:hypothetical protein